MNRLNSVILRIFDPGMISNEKLTENGKLRRLKLRGLKRNQISTSNFIYENDSNKINTLSDF